MLHCYSDRYAKPAEQALSSAGDPHGKLKGDAAAGDNNGGGGGNCRRFWKHPKSQVFLSVCKSTTSQCWLDGPEFESSRRFSHLQTRPHRFYNPLGLQFNGYRDYLE